MPQPSVQPCPLDNAAVPDKAIRATKMAGTNAAEKGFRRRSVARGASKHPLVARIRPPQLQLRTGGAAGSYYENNDFENVWLREFLSHEKSRTEAMAKKDLLNFMELPGSTVHPHAANHHLTRQTSKFKKGEGERVTVPDHERQRLDVLDKALQETNLKKTTMMEKTTKTKSRRKKFTPYVKANSKIARVLQQTKPRGMREDMQASQLNDFYALVTRETSAAIRLQSQCRRVLATEYVNGVRLETRMATRIQSFVRGYFAQELLRRLKEQRERARCIRERLVRMHVARCQRRRRMDLERDSATICQSVIRMHFAKREARLRRLQRSWELNQTRWRAVSTRLAWADLRINCHARQIQCVARRRLARRRVSSVFAVHTDAAVLIQSAWRGYLARRRRRDVSFRLEVDRRCDKIRIIASEHRYWEQRLEEAMKPAKLRLKEDLVAKRAVLERQQREKYEQIYALESHYKDQLQIHQQITPRAIAGGWEEQGRINLDDTRQRITKAKLELFFDVRKKLVSVLEEINQIERSETDAKATLEHWSAWRQSEQDKLWAFQRRRDRKAEERDRRHSVINEQMRWAVKFTVPSGKPDKRRALLHGPVGKDDDRRSGERVQWLADAAKLKADDFQAASHLSNTFRPFDQLWRTYNALAGNDRLGGSGRHERSGGTAPHATSRFKPAKSRQTREGAFPGKLPWDLLEKARQERRDIRLKFEAKV